MSAMLIGMTAESEVGENDPVSMSGGVQVV